MIGRNDVCPCGSGKKFKKCCIHKTGANGPRFHSDEAKRYFDKYGILLKTPKQIEGIRKACALSGKILDDLVKMSKEGVTTNTLDAYAHKATVDAGGTPAPLGYGDPPFPKSICTSLNEVICHGIPNDQPLKNGDIMNIDYSCVLDGYYGDCSRMVMIGDASPERKNVLETAYDCLMDSIAICKPGLPLYAIGDAIEERAAKTGCSVVYQFVGHGVGIHFHEEPQVYHHKNDNKTPLAAGMTFTIEPMINAGVREGTLDRSNHWEARTVDGKASAQWEHTILITNEGYEILTPTPDGKIPPCYI